jgi:hypothetical protein
MSELDFIDGAEDFDRFDPQDLDRAQAAFEEQKEQDEDTVKRVLERRRKAYAAVFSEGHREQSDIDIVLADLMWFCRVRAPSYDIRDGIHAEELSKRKEGRREVFNRIEDFARLDFDALLLMYTDATTK